MIGLLWVQNDRERKQDYGGDIRALIRELALACQRVKHMKASRSSRNTTQFQVPSAWKDNALPSKHQNV